MVRAISRCWPAAIAAGMLLASAECSSAFARAGETAPLNPELERRLITVEDLAGLKRIERVETSRDGQRTAVFVYHGNVKSNDYIGEWFIVPLRAGRPARVDTGPIQLDASGYLWIPDARWSPNGNWLAYTALHDGEVQLWLVDANGKHTRQVTQSPADVQQFEWTDDGSAILYKTKKLSRSEISDYNKRRSLAGYQYDVDLRSYADLMLPPQMLSPAERSTFNEFGTGGWAVDIMSSHAGPWSPGQRSLFDRAQAQRGRGGSGRVTSDSSGTGELGAGENGAAIVSLEGARAWIRSDGKAGRSMRIMVQLAKTDSTPIECTAAECVGPINQLWWLRDGRLAFWRSPAGDVFGGLYLWKPRSRAVQPIRTSEYDYIKICQGAGADRLVCAHEGPTRPPQLVSIDLRSGKLQEIFDVNPEFKNITLGKVERIEWKTPKFSWNEKNGVFEGVYPKRAHGFILYPPNFDPRKKYPLIVEPYSAYGFENDVQKEYPLHVYAANGFVVLNSQFPLEDYSKVDFKSNSDLMEKIYSMDLDYPLLTMYTELTLGGINELISRGFVDKSRVGIGGVSHGAFISLYLLQKHDVLSAVSVSGGSWNEHSYYWSTGRTRERLDWMPEPVGRGKEFWRRIDLADHTAQIEAPILFNLPAHEATFVPRLLRNLSDASLPYDAYVFSNETHLKWQPAHLSVIKKRNLDWFRFWLQDIEDSDPEKAEQYARWRALRDNQCRNPRSLRNFCNLDSTTTR